MILTPTRELSLQVAEELNSLKGRKKIKIIPIYGGQSIDLQFRRLQDGVDVVVGTTHQIYFEVNEDDKFEALCRIRDIVPDFYGIVFCRTKVDVYKLIDRGYSA